MGVKVIKGEYGALRCEMKNPRHSLHPHPGVHTPQDVSHSAPFLHSLHSPLSTLISHQSCISLSLPSMSLPPALHFNALLSVSDTLSPFHLQPLSLISPSAIHPLTCIHLSLAWLSPAPTSSSFHSPTPSVLQRSQYNVCPFPLEARQMVPYLLSAHSTLWA